MKCIGGGEERRREQEREREVVLHEGDYEDGWQNRF